MEQRRRRAKNSGLEDHSLVTGAGFDSKQGEFVSFSHILAHLGMSGMERLARNVGTATEVVRLDTGSSCPFKPSKRGFEKTVGGLSQSDSFCSTAKSKGETPSTFDVKTRVLRPRHRPRLSGPLPPTPTKRARTVDTGSSPSLPLEPMDSPPSQKVMGAVILVLVRSEILRAWSFRQRFIQGIIAR